MEYGYYKETNMTYEQALERVPEVLKTEGFGVLTTIDVKDTLKKKIDVDFDRYMILGACNPPFAHKALQAEESIGLLMPCNVIIHEKDGKVKISVFNPMIIAQVSDNPKLKDLSVMLNEKIQSVLSNL
ncbi:MAG: DUF302 domain-containing protein [Ignavibacteria bacterium]|jgi:uncharacterized protein (DUF302 family)|nr:DUF302 domain-containing protein [Ignavibacteria bacterium]